jgi:hypothetical protein
MLTKVLTDTKPVQETVLYKMNVPHEITNRICAWLANRDLVHVSSVSRLWHHAATGHLGYHLRLKIINASVNVDEVMGQFNGHPSLPGVPTRPQTVTSIQMTVKRHHSTPYDFDRLYALLDRLSHVRRLSLKEMYEVVDDFDVDATISAEICNRLNNVQHLTLDTTRNIKFVSVEDRLRVGWHYVDLIKRYKLKSLDLNLFHGFMKTALMDNLLSLHGLLSLTVSYDSIAHAQAFYTHVFHGLKEYHLREFGGMYTLTDSDKQRLPLQLAKSFPDVETLGLNVYACGFLYSIDVAQLLEQVSACTHLKELLLYGFQYIVPPAMTPSLSFPRVERLSLMYTAAQKPLMTMLTSFSWPSLVYARLFVHELWLTTVADMLDVAPKVHTIFIEHDAYYGAQPVHELDRLQGKKWLQLLNLCVMANGITHDMVDALTMACPNSTIHVRPYLSDKRGYCRHGVNVPAERQGMCKACKVLTP